MPGLPLLDALLEGGVRGRRVLLRADLNVPMRGDQVMDTTRLETHLPTLRELSKAGAKTGVLSHRGRPGGKPDAALSLKPIAAALATLAGSEIIFSDDISAVDSLPDGGVTVFENTRFHPGETAGDSGFAALLAGHGDAYVNDAFSVSHRADASVVALAGLLPAYAGRSLAAELTALDSHLTQPKTPVVAVVGGAKVSTKISLLERLVERVDTLAVVGAMANTFLFAQGVGVGRSLCEPEMAAAATAVLERAAALDARVILPVDAVVAESLAPHVPARTVPVDGVPESMMILDAGPQTLSVLAAHFETAGTVVWNGPLGAFETPPFAQATETAARHVAMLSRIGQLVSVAGGGETVAALNEAGAAKDFTHVSPGGGAFLAWLEGRALPGVEALMNSKPTLREMRS